MAAFALQRACEIGSRQTKNVRFCSSVRGVARPGTALATKF